MIFSEPDVGKARAATYSLWRQLGLPLRLRSISLLLLLVVNSFFEMVSLGAVVPATMLILDPIAARDFIDFHDLNMGSIWLGHTDIVNLAMIALLILFLAKFIFQLFVIKQIAAFSCQIKADLTEKLFATYLAQPIVFYRQRNTADLVNSVQDEMFYAALALTSLVNLLAEMLVVVSIMTLLVLMTPWMGIGAAALMGVVAAALVAWNRAALESHGHAYRENQASKQRWMQQSFTGIKAITVSGQKQLSLEAFATHNHGSAAARAHLDVLGASPRLWLELLMAFAIVAMVLAMQQADQGAATTIPALALFAAAAFRLLPSINRIISTIQSLNFAFPSIQHVARELAIPIPPNQVEAQDPLLPFCRELVAKDINFIFPGSQKHVLSNFNLVLPYGSTAGITGVSGSGKTTAVDIITGLLSPNSGYVAIDGQMIGGRIAAWHRQIGYASQDTFLVDDTLRRNVALGVADPDIDDNAVMQALNDAQLTEFVAELPCGLETQLGENGSRLSGGQRQRFGLARALYRRPRLLVLDEPTSALDQESEAKIATILDALHGKITILLVSHQKAILRTCDQVFSLTLGRALEPHEITNIGQ